MPDVYYVDRIDIVTERQNVSTKCKYIDRFSQYVEIDAIYRHLCRTQSKELP